METKITGWEWPRNNSKIKNSKIGAFGCSHTWGHSVEHHQAWPWLLGANNFGFVSGSTDFISRNLKNTVKEYKLEKVYILYPNYTRFEYTDEHGWIWQSNPTDENRYIFREQNEELWLTEHHDKNKKYIRNFCKDNNILLIDLEFEDLHQIIGYPDTWPRASDGMHFDCQWHRWVADIFKNHEKTRN
jgi:hypothetical protein